MALPVDGQSCSRNVDNRPSGRSPRFLIYHKDVVFEVFHNFVALSQWGNTMYNIMLKLAKDTGDPEARAWFKRTMEGSPDDAGGKPFTPLERFVMELFRTITPNGGSIWH